MNSISSINEGYANAVFLVKLWFKYHGFGMYATNIEDIDFKMLHPFYTPAFE